jgi:hypothetical protein
MLALPCRIFSFGLSKRAEGADLRRVASPHRKFGNIVRSTTYAAAEVAEAEIDSDAGLIFG